MESFQAPTSLEVQNVMPTLERFVILLYDRTSSETSVDEARKDMYCRKNRQIDNIPPTADALYHNTMRCTFIAGYVWGQSLVYTPVLPCPSQWGWKREDDCWEPHWTSLPPVSKACREFIKCGCYPEKGCRNRCKCVRADLQCSPLCRCKGTCDRL